MSITLPASKQQTKFEDIVAGSLIEISDRQNPRTAPREASVLVTHREYGAQGMPALLVSFEVGDREPQLVMGNGRYTVRVLEDVQRPAVNIPPAGTIRLEVRQKTALAMEFSGGGDSASRIIRWAQGVAAIHYVAQNGTEEEHLTVFTPAGEQTAYIGDAVVRVGDVFSVSKPNDLADAYDIKGVADGMSE